MFVHKSFDVFVLGGGIAGISAALSASRQGKKVLLCEKSYILGGLATSGLVTIYLPLCDGKGTQVSFGIAEELLKLSIKDWHSNCGGYNDWIANKDTKKTENNARFEVDFNPSLFSLGAEELLLKNGVEILYGTMVVDCVKKGNKIDCVVTENKSGRLLYRAKTFVDASGDCDLAYFSKTQTTLFQQGNILASWYYYLLNGQNTLKALGACDIPDEEKKNGASVELLSSRRFGGIDGEEISEMVQLSHKVMYKNIQSNIIDDPKSIPLLIPTIPQIRMTRRINGEFTLNKENAENRYESSIGLVSNWKKRGPVYEVPFEILYNKNTPNLICAGRCVSNDDYMWDILRVIPCCAVTGEAAGLAATLTDDFSKINIKLLQDLLESRGVVLHK